jgi:hypothetical protein
VSKYQKGTSVLSGETEFNFQDGNFDFHSTSYEYLVVNGSKAQYGGSGTVKGIAACSTGGCSFKLTAYDGNISGAVGGDRFRIKVWDQSGYRGTVVYDNARGVSDDIDAANPQALGGGSIVIHK